LQIVYFDCQPAVDTDSLTASFFSAGLSFDDWYKDIKMAGKCLGFDFDIALADALCQSVQVKALRFEHGRNSAPDDIMPARDVLNDLEKCQCDDSVKNLSRTIFSRLLESEAQVRGISLSQLMLSKQILEKTLLQIIGFALAYKSMKIDNVFSAPVSLLSGQNLWSAKKSTADFSPQTIDFLVREAAAATISESVGLTSAVVAAVLTTVVSNWSMPSFGALRQVGYGSSGSNSQDGVCRTLFGDLKAARFRSELISVLEANLDDLSPQILSFAAEELFATGALDVFISPVIMKKGRGGHLLTVLCNLEDKEKMQSTIFAQTSTLGIRSYDCERSIAEREFKSVLLEEGHQVRIKIGFDLQGNIVNAQPEYEDCAAYARFSGQSVQEVIRLALTKVEHKSLKSVVVAILFACFISLPVLAKSTAAQFSHTLGQARASSLRNEGGFEIYSWNVGGKWHYSLLPASKQEKTLSEVTEYSVTLKSFIELEAALGKLAPCIVTWHNHVLKENDTSDNLSMPHRVVLSQLKKYCQTRQIKLVL
jgi:pyridinium-3,5-bisthiocarboxylic acid mononucleotide nickel chelatase